MQLGSEGLVGSFLAETLMVLSLSLSLSTQVLVSEVWEEEVSSESKLGSSWMVSGFHSGPPRSPRSPSLRTPGGPGIPQFMDGASGRDLPKPLASFPGGPCFLSHGF